MSVTGTLTVSESPGLRAQDLDVPITMNRGAWEASSHF
jgi:hypothetical protein